MVYVGFGYIRRERYDAFQRDSEVYRRYFPADAYINGTSLEADGLIKRDVYPEVPPRVEYTLTDRGRSLMPLLKELVRWALDNQEQILEGRANLDAQEEVKG